VLDQKETKQNLRTRFPADRKPCTGNYGYDADSDLEEDEDWDFSDNEDIQPVSENLKGKRGGESDSGALVDTRNSDARGIISVSDVNSPSSASVETKAEAEAVAAHAGIVVILKDVAFVT
jgi:hypothetical protein